MKDTPDITQHFQEPAVLTPADIKRLSEEIAEGYRKGIAALKEARARLSLLDSNPQLSVGLREVRLALQRGRTARNNSFSGLLLKKESRSTSSPAS